MKHIYLVQHGETDYNKRHINQGSEIDVTMNHKGVLQAQKTAEYLKTRGPFDIIYASPSIRTTQTATLISTQTQTPIVYNDLLLEKRNGKLAGMDKKDPVYIDYNAYKKSLKGNDPIENKLNEELYANEADKKFDIGKETESELRQRCHDFIDILIDSPHSRIIVTGHASMLCCLIKTLFKIPHVSNAGNCFISYLQCNVDGFKMITEPNILHL